MVIFGRLTLPTVLAGVFFILAAISSRSTFASEPLLNSDFEDYHDDSFSPWLKNVSTLTLSATTSSGLVYSGSQAAVLGSSTNSTKYLYQVLAASPSASYRLSGWTKLLSGQGSAYLRITQCKTEACSNSSEEIKSSDSSKLTNPTGEELALQVTTATDTVSLKVKLSLDPLSATPTALVWDAIHWEMQDSSSSGERVATQAASSSSDQLFSLSYDLLPVVTADTPFLVAITISGAAPNTSYFVKTVGGVSTGSADLRAVSTLNASGSGFLAWNGSWASMPSVTTDASGSASLVVESRFNSAATVIGNNLFFVRIRKTDSETNLDGPLVAVGVLTNQATSSGTSAESPETAEAVGPAVTFETSGTAFVGSPIVIKLKVTGLSGRASYSYKVRLGSSETNLIKGATAHDDVYLTDSSPWSKFPSFTTDDGGTWLSEVKGLVRSEFGAGDYYLKIRIRDLSSGKIIDSAVSKITLATKSEESTESESATLSGVVLGSTTTPLVPPLVTVPPGMPAEVMSLPLELVVPTEVPSNDLGTHLLSMGLFLLGSSFLWSVKLLAYSPS